MLVARDFADGIKVADKLILVQKGYSESFKYAQCNHTSPSQHEDSHSVTQYKPEEETRGEMRQKAGGQGVGITRQI